MKNLVSLKLVKTKIRLIAILIGYALSMSTLNAQTITVSVEDGSLLALEKLEIYISTTEAKYNSPKVISKENIASELNKMKLESYLLNSRLDTTYFKKGTSKEQTRIRRKSNYQFVIDNFEDRDDLLRLIKNHSNITIDSTSIQSRNADETLEKISKELLVKAKIEANKMAKLLDRKATKLANIKVLVNRAGKNTFKLQEEAYVKLEVTFDTENL